MIQICFFASLREQLGVTNLSIEARENLTVKMVAEEIVNTHSDWADIFQDKQLLCAVNHQIVSPTTIVKDNDEVAFFPPVTGG
ncbi:molybdopterin converting factor subunit 1 [Glaciecola sp. 1036]|uniref:molybdopterin converting factor subunit 1 n=1 Tax=Alteromonadaceae TaxID=72275 RepID=UPI003CFBF5FD